MGLKMLLTEKWVIVFAITVLVLLLFGNKLTNLCRKSNMFAWLLTFTGVALMIYIAWGR